MGRKPRIKTRPDEPVVTDPEDDTVVDEGVDADADADAVEDVAAEVDPDSDNVGDVSVEINVEALIAQIELAERKGESPGHARRKLEDYLEERRTSRDIMDFEDYELDD